MRFYNRLNMKKKINKVQEFKSSGVQKSTHEVPKFQSSRVPESTLKPLNPVTLEPLKEGWQRVRLGEVCEITMGQSPPGASYNSDGLGVPLLNGPTEFGPINPAPVQWTISPTRFAEPGDILLCVRGATTGRKNIADRRYCVGRGLAAIQGRNEQATTSFLWFVLDIFTDSLIGQTSGSTFPNLPGEKLKRVEIPLPPLPEQNRIAAKLQELMQEVVRARTACEKQLEAAKALPAAYLREVFESEEAKKWERNGLGEVISFIKNGIVAEQNFDGKGFQVTRIETISNGVIDSEKIGCVNLPEGNFTDFKLSKGDILFSHINSVERLGNCAIYEGIPESLYHGMNLLRIKSDERILDPYFLSYWLRSESCRNYYITNARRAIGQASLNQKDIKQIQIHLPTLHIQQRIAADLKEKMAEVEKLRTSIEKQFEAINALPQAVLRKAFRGEL